MDVRKAQAWGWGRGARERTPREVKTNREGLVHDACRQREAPCGPKGSMFHSNWPSCDRKFVFHRSAARTRSW